MSGANQGKGPGQGGAEGSSTRMLRTSPPKPELGQIKLKKQLLDSVTIPDDERLQIGGRFAEGGVGTIRAMRDRVLQRDFAAKLLKKSFVSEPLVLRGFLREAQVTAQLDHPNVVPVHELRIEDGIPYFTMSRIQGESLESWLDENILIDHDTATELVEILLKVCDALSYAHSKGVLHCDLKPDNIMLGAYGQVYLMDWGGAELFGEAAADGSGHVLETLPPLPASESEGKIFGTPGYMPPERARGEGADVRSDIFSLGAILYRFIMGKSPFGHADFVEALRSAQVCRHEPIDERAHEGILPVELLRIVSKSIAANPADRHQTVVELKADLTRVIRGGGSFPLRQLEKGEHVIREGEAGSEAYIVASGRLEVYRTVDDNKVRLRELGRGDLFGEMAIFASSPRTASVVALEPSSVAEITSEAMRSEMDTMKPWMAAFVRTLAQRFHESETRKLEVEVEKKTRKSGWWRR